MTRLLSPELRESRQNSAALGGRKRDNDPTTNLDEFFEREGAHFLPRIGFVCMLSITVWFTITYAISFAKDPEKHTDIEQSGVIFGGGMMATLCAMGLIGSCKDEPSMIIQGMIGMEVATFMAGHSLVRMVLETISNGGVYDVPGRNNDTRCVTCPLYYETYSHYCNAITVVHILTGVLLFLLSATLLHSDYLLWKYLTSNKRTSKRWIINNMIENEENRIRSQQQLLEANDQQQNAHPQAPQVSIPAATTYPPMPPPRYYIHDSFDYEKKKSGSGESNDSFY